MDLLNCFLLTQSTLLFGQTSPLKGELRNRFNLISEERIKFCEQNSENLMKIGWKIRKLWHLSFTNFHKTFLDQSKWICKWASWWCHRLTNCHIFCTYNFEKFNILRIVCPPYQAWNWKTVASLFCALAFPSYYSLEVFDCNSRLHPTRYSRKCYHDSYRCRPPCIQFCALNTNCTAQIMQLEHSGCKEKQMQRGWQIWHLTINLAILMKSI